jgi:outer membrane receptor protein involved in Fe transport
MKRIAIILLSIVTLSAAGFAVEIRGKVVSPEGRAVEGAVLLHRESGTKAVTDSGGTFLMDVSEAFRIRLEVIHPDFFEQEFVISRKKISRVSVITLTPFIRQNEEIVVTALRYPEAAASVPAAESVVRKEALAENQPANVTEGLSAVPGVGALGSGGFSLVPSVRGLARRRVLYLVDGARLSSERRTGPNASFISIEDIDRIEVLRSSASVLYGSDAIGGVIHILTREPELRDGIRGRLLAKYATINGEKGAGLALEGARGSTGFALSFQGLDAGDYSSPSGKVLQSRYTQGSLFGKIIHRTEKRDITAMFLGARGKDIGKPNRDVLTKPTWYPKEDQNLLQLRWVEKKVAGGDLAFQAFVNPNSLDTRTDKLSEGVRTKTSMARTKSTEYGFQISYGHKFGGHFHLSGGADVFGQAGARAENTDTSFDSTGALTKVSGELPYTRGSRADAGVFLSADYSGIRKLDLVGGLRWDSLTMKAAPGDGDMVRSHNEKMTGFLGASYKLPWNLVAFADVSRAYRVPSLNERFYTGISGRGFIIAQPGLTPETSLNLDGGVKYIGRRLFLGVYAFTYTIDNMIERYTQSEGIYTYGNIDKGRLKGLEFEFEIYPVQGWKIFGNLFTIDGRSVATGAALNDVPPFRAYIGTKAWAGRFWGELNAAFQSRKDDPGPAEIGVSASELVNFKTGYRWNDSLNAYVLVSNVFNKAYLARPDSDAMEEPGRSLSVGLSFAF